MKKILFLAFIFASISFSVSAQQQRQNAPKTFDNRNGMKHEKAGQLKDLNLTDAQKAELKKSNEALKAKMQALRSQDITPEERQKQMEDIVLRINEYLGYDFNTVELAVRDGIPYAIDFGNPAPDAELTSVGEENFEWVVEAAANYAIEVAMNQKEGQLNINWGEFVKRSATGHPLI